MIDISVIIPSYNEGDSVEVFLRDLVSQLKKLNLNWEILFLDNDTEHNSETVIRELRKTFPNIYGFQLSHPGIAVEDKSNKYMLGFELAKGRYIFHMDADGQDRPEEIDKFIEKLEEGFDLVVGYKKKRKDNFLYTLPSRGINALVRFITGVRIHDMNNGFKGYKASVAKSLNLRGGEFRFIPIILSAQNKEVTEVVVEHRKRIYGEGKFSFFSRLKGGFFDLLPVLFRSKLPFLFKQRVRENSYKQLIIKEY